MCDIEILGSEYICKMHQRYLKEREELLLYFKAREEEKLMRFLSNIDEEPIKVCPYCHKNHFLKYESLELGMEYCPICKKEIKEEDLILI